MPVRGRRPTPGSLANRAIYSGKSEYDEDSCFAVVARPVFWKGRLAKIAVVAVRYHHRAMLAPQLADHSFDRADPLSVEALPW